MREAHRDLVVLARMLSSIVPVTRRLARPWVAISTSTEEYNSYGVQMEGARDEIR